METVSVPVRSSSSPWANPNLKPANLASVNSANMASVNAAESVCSENKSEISDETYQSDFPPLPLTARRIGGIASRGVSSDDELLKKVPSVNHLTFNQDNACFVIGSDLGFIVYNCDPFSERMRRIFDKGSGIGIVEMLHQSNLFALVGVGGADDPLYPSSKVLMWSDQLNGCTGELSCRSVVRSVRLRRDRIIIVLEQKIMLYNYEDFKLLRQIETVPNPKGLCAVSQTSGSFVLICPGLLKGQVKVERYESSGSRREKIVVAHSSSIECFALSQDGQMFATASSKGTLIRVFNVVDGNLVKEVRRGADRADIYSLAFSPSAEWLAVSSDKGTVHVFSLRMNYGTPEDTPNNNAGGILSSTSLSYIKGVLPKYFSSEWSLAQFRLPEDRKYIVSFGHKKNTVQIVGVDGSFYRCEFDPVLGGEMTQLEYYNFLTPKETF